MLSYNGNLRFVINADQSIFPSNEVLGKLIRSIEEEFDELKNLSLDVKRRFGEIKKEKLIELV
jgi:hypothetical protein